MTDQPHWKFTEDQRHDVCLGKLCPACLGTDVECIGSVPALVDANLQFRCRSCLEEWEGY